MFNFKKLTGWKCCICNKRIKIDKPLDILITTYNGKQINVCNECHSKIIKNQKQLNKY